MTRLISHFAKPEMAGQLLDLCASKGITIMYTCVDRTYLEQTALFAQGRKPLAEVNVLRAVAGLAPITAEENRRKVTWTMNSKHIVNLDDERLDNDKSRALDFAILDKGRVSWDVKADVNSNNILDYQEVGQIAESIGFTWGGRFSSPDYPHVEI